MPLLPWACGEVFVLPESESPGGFVRNTGFRDQRVPPLPGPTTRRARSHLTGGNDAGLAGPNDAI